MGNVIEIPPIQETVPMEEKYLCVAAYCRVSTDQEEQDSSIELQELRYRQMIEENPNWENAGVFSERATGLNLQERSAFQAMIPV